MAFLSYNDVRSELPTSAKQADVVRYLAIIEAELQSMGLVFAPIEVGATKRFYNTHSQYMQYIYDIRWCTNITSVRTGIGQSETVLDATEYLISRHTRLDKNYQLEVRTVLNYADYISITADWGLDVDMSNARYDLLKSAIVAWLINRIEYAKRGDRTVVESRIGDSTTKYDTNSIKPQSLSFINDEEYQSIINLYTV